MNTRTNQATTRVLLGLLVALGVGGLHFALGFSDLAPGETMALRTLEFYVAAFLAGAVLGLFVVGKWAILCVVGSWGAILAAGMLLVMHERLWIQIGPGSLVALLLGGAAGALLRRLGPVQRLVSSR